MAYVGASRPRGPCIFCEALAAGDDRGRLVVTRRSRAFLILNAYPYASGHLMAVVNRHVGTVRDATAEELAGAMGLVQEALALLAAEYRPDGFNIGINEGRAAGAGVEDHLHVHVVPRWHGDASFMQAVGEVRVLPEALAVTWDRLRKRVNG
jgi:ATP adenylyltransferase